MNNIDKLKKKSNVYCPLSHRSTSVVSNRRPICSGEVLSVVLFFFLHAKQRVDMTGRYCTGICGGQAKNEYRVIEQSSKNKKQAGGRSPVTIASALGCAGGHIELLRGCFD